MQCPICGNGNLGPLADGLRNSPGKVFHCALCDLGILDVLVGDPKEYYDHYYRKKFSDCLKNPSDDPARIFAAHANSQADRLSLVAPFAGPGKTLLEVGCSAGQFLNLARDLFECQGLELNERCAAYVRERFGLPVHTRELTGLGLAAESFDAVVAFQVLEHLPDPAVFLREARRLLRPGGRIFIEVPNLHDALRVLWRIPAYRKFYFHEAHTFYFSRASLEKLFDLCELTVERIHFLQDYNVFNHVYWHFTNAPQPNSAFGLAPPRFPWEEAHAVVGRRINALFETFDRDYKALLAEAGLASNIFCVVRRD
uniref:Methyltransferase family protein n=1 Tax=Desulfovibrio sp. U5L TaxID=596152 RepID=I2Q7L8_9BACT